MLARKMVMAQAYLQLVLLEFLCQINVMLMKTYVNFEHTNNIYLDLKSHFKVSPGPL